MAYLGLVPSEYSSGPRQQRGGITRTGNRHVRRLLIEAAWHYRHKPRVGEKLALRRHGQPAELVGYLWATLTPAARTASATR